MSPSQDTRARRAVPIIVLASDFPVGPFTLQEIYNQVRREGLLLQPGCLSPGIVMVHELEALAGFCSEANRNVVTILRQWRQEREHRFLPLSDYLVAQGMTGRRRELIQGELDAFFSGVIERLFPSPGVAEPQGFA